MKFAAYLDGKEMRVNLTVTVFGVPIKVAGTVQVLDVTVPTSG